MDKIKNFNYQILSNSDDKISIDDKLSVFETFPNIFTWSFREKDYSIQNKNKLIALLLENIDLIAVIEAPFNIEFNKAYIIDGTGKTIMNISNLFREKYKHLVVNKSIIFSDVYIINRVLFFFVVINNIDFRLEIDLINGLILDLIESR